MQITLLKDHETPTGSFKAGEVIEVDEATYNWLMSVYMAERKQLVEAEAKAVEQLRKHKVLK